MFWYHLPSKAPFCSLLHSYITSPPPHTLSGYQYLLSGLWGLCGLASRPVLDFDLVPFRAFNFICSFLPSSTFPAGLGLQSLCPVSVRKTHPVAVWGYFNTHKVSKNHTMEEIWYSFLECEHGSLVFQECHDCQLPGSHG